MKHCIRLCLLTLTLLTLSASACWAADAGGDKKMPDTTDANAAYVFSSFVENGQDGLHLSYSLDGSTWSPLNGGKSFLRPMVGGKLMRDPCLIHGPDGMFHMVWTTSWSDRGIGIAHSKDLVKWSRQNFIPVMKHEPRARNCWAPEITWDPNGRQYVIYWATTIRDRFIETAKAGDRGWNHRIYCTTTKDFETYTKTKLFYEPGFNVIDSTIVRGESRFFMILKDETRYPPAKNLRVATSPSATGPWSAPAKPFTPKGLWVEGPTCARIGDYWYVYFDAYQKSKYGAMRTKDFKEWEDVSDQLRMPDGTRHGTIVKVTRDVLAKLLGK